VERGGVVLLVVISLLVLFALVGIAFVVYAEAQANTSRIWREGETIDNPDMDPELLLAYFLGQFIYDTDNPLSALRGHGLARNMYGRPGGTVPFNGTGRIHTPGQDDYYNVDYTAYPWNAGRNPDQFGSPNPPYTYPDFNHMYLGAVRASDGAVLTPSYYRIGPNGQAVTLRPDTRYHTRFPPLADPSGDVKNRPDSAGYKNGPNDSIWIDAGFPVMTAADGRKFKPLFAPLIEDLDNRVNVNVHGNVLSDIIQRFNTWCISHQGWNPGEVSLDPVLTGPNFEVKYIFNGNNGVPGRYDQAWWPTNDNWNTNQQWLRNVFCPGGHFYAGTDIDCWCNNEPDSMTMPQANTGFGFPWFNEAYSHSWWNSYDEGMNPNLYNFFDPTQNWYWSGGPPAQRLNNRAFHVRNLEALLRYGDKGSPALLSDLFLLCPQSFSSAKTRRLVTTHSFDLARPGVIPSVYNPPGPSLFTLALPQPGQPPSVPSRPPMDLPGRLPNSGEFGPNWGAVADAAKGLLLKNRIDLNRGFVDYPQPNPNGFTDLPTFQNALQNRQQLVQEIFDVLRAVGAAGDPATANPGTPEYDALRWLAQLAVNIVDYSNFPNPNWTPAPDDVMTSFNWNPAQKANVNNGWVFGTVLPRLVVNEAYIQINNTQADQQNKPQKATKYDVNCWVELHNPFASDNGSQVNNHPAVPVSCGGVARLFVPDQGFNKAAYRLIIAQTVADANPNQSNQQELTKNDNVLGIPTNVQTVVDQYNPDTPPPPTGQQNPAQLALGGDNLNQVQPVNLNRNNNARQAITNSSAGGNQGFYVLGPNTPFPGTESSMTFFATLPVKDQTCQADPSETQLAGKSNSMHYTYTPANAQLQNFNNLNHTIVLQRLACPYLPPQPLPSDPNKVGYFNPYVTVDYMLQVPINDAVTVDGTGMHQSTPVAQRYSVGRNQPYAADPTQQVPQKVNYDPAQLTNGFPPPAANPPSFPQNTFFCANIQGLNAQGQPVPGWPYDWLTFLNRWVVSPMELLFVSGYKPHQLTQMFMTGQTDPQSGKPPPQGKFAHRAPWFQSPAMIYRALEFIEAGMRPQWSPIGGRFTGRININTMWDLDTFQALCDVQPSNYFTAQGVTNVFNNFTRSRTVNPSGMPGPGDRPFLGMAAPFAPAGLQYPQGASADDTLLRSDPNSPPGKPLKRLFETSNDPATGEMRTDPYSQQQVDNPFLTFELLTKICNNVTTRSHVFAVWLTVGFFEVLDDINPSAPPVLGQEIGRSENRHIRHRMFAVVDRSALTLDPNTPGKPGPRPFFINSVSAVSQPGQATITVPAVGGNYEDMTWSINVGDTLVVDAGPKQEPVTVIAVTPNAPGGPQLTLQGFTQAHAAGFAISNALLGNPGPQPRFECRNPSFTGLVRYFSIID
jgi:hypothetical protein